MDEWQEITLGQLIDIKHGWAFKGEFFKETEKPKNIVVAIGNFDYTGGFRFASTKLKEYTESFPEEYRLDSGDILLAMTCQTAGGEILGIPGRIPDDGQTYLHNQRLGKVEFLDQETNSSFVYWLCLWRHFNHHLVATATGTKILHTAPARIKSFTFYCPPVNEQVEIGKTLDSLDRKIENLRKQNETLEAIAQTLFKHWFVDFEFPDENGNPYKSSGGAMVRSELGEIPEEWKVGILSEIATFKNGKSPPVNSKDFTIPIYGSNGIIGYSNVSNTCKSVMIGRVGTYCGSLYYCIDQCWVTDNAMIGFLRDSSSHAYLYFFLAKSRLNRLSGGSGQPLLNQRILSSIELVIPSPQSIYRFEEIVDPLFRKIFFNYKSSQILTQTRDILLPKLMSGRLRIKS